VDTYVVSSIKQAERIQRGESKVHLLGGPSTKVPRDFSIFLMENENKVQLIKFITGQWQSSDYAKRLHGQSVYIVCADSCIHVISSDGEVVIATVVVFCR